jgi:SAM-dependent methyltransferase
MGGNFFVRAKTNMGIIGGTVGYHLLRAISPDGKQTICGDGDPYEGASKLDTFFGADFWDELKGKAVIDYGCGVGKEAVEMARRGAREVIGIDIRESVLTQARTRATQEGLAQRCTFCTTTDARVDTLVSLDSFEHFEEPQEVLEAMRILLKPCGKVWIVFGPPWYHPAGGHLFSVFPWAHLVFTESALIRWRSDFKTDGATRFSEVAGGLNQMTIRRFQKLISESPFRFEYFDLVPIRRLRYLANRLTREFFTSCVRCRLVLRK